ncbi:MAG: tRNA (adenosine(37)-N6)-dimethylallyltransferase MiaA [Puniceicoccales bacterium]|jgi:tRNA dimethylallyltransferase|nr:tRNA (adenosine(37)-N6)-dimethylallyltransferase MiaA [Puniceicoccales bacterium]
MFSTGIFDQFDALVMEFTPQIWFLAGCTAVGKTELSLALAHQINGEILSCDSLQVYRGADIGSAKIKPEQMQGIPHHGIDLSPPDEKFDVGQYVRYARSVVDRIQKKGKNVLVVGGTGFYLKSFFTGVTDSIVVPEAIRREVRSLYAEEGLLGLQRAVGSYGPHHLNDSDWHNPRRLSSILGKQKITGLSQVELRQNFEQTTCPFLGFTRRVILLERDSDSLRRRIEQRVEKMLLEGLIEEVRNLGKMCLPLSNGIGYREVQMYLDGKMGNPSEERVREILKESIISATHRLVKKQRTWFRRQIPVDFRINLDEYSSNKNFDFMVSFCRNGGIWV